MPLLWPQSLHDRSFTSCSEHAGEIIPIEVKWTENPTASDARHLRTFIAEQKGKAKRGYVVCRCDRPMQLDADITAIPWHHL